MCDDLIHPGLVDDPRLTRRAFGLIAVAATATAATLPSAAVTEQDVMVKTPDGVCDAVLFTPAKTGKYSAVLIWPDIMGLRPAFREMGRRLAAQGHVVLVPNPFYRSKKAPVIEGPVDFGNPATRATLMGFRKAIGDAGAARDATAYFAFLDAQKKTDRTRRAGVQGYCMGGALSIITAAALPARIGAVASFHGGGLVTAEPTSPHLLIPKTRARFLMLVAQNDDKQSPAIKDQLKSTFAAAHRPATVEVYPADHGWCVPGSAVYNQVQAERAWTALTALYRVALG